MDWEQKAKEYVKAYFLSFLGTDEQYVRSLLELAYAAGIRAHTDWAQKELDSD